MKQLFILSVLFLSHSIFAGQTITPKIPLADFFRDPEVIQVRLSPDGKNLAWLAPYENRLNIFVKPVEGNAPAKRLTSMTDRGISRIYWKGGDRLLFTRDFDGDENDHIFSVALDGSPARDLTPFAGSKSGINDMLEHISSTDILIDNNKRNAEIFDLYRLNIETGDLKLVIENPGNVSGYLTDNDGIPRLAIAPNGLQNDILYRQSADEPFKKVMSIDFNDEFNPSAFSYDNPDQILVASNLGRDRQALVLFNMKTLKEEKVILDDPEVDVGTMYQEATFMRSDVRKKLTAVMFRNARLQYRFFDDETAEMFRDIRALLNTDADINVKSATDDEKTFMIAVQSDRQFAKYYIYRMGEANPTKRLVMVANSSPWIREEQMAKMVPVKYTARDGVVINGYLTLPINVEAKNLPLIMHPHGGPWGIRDNWGFEDEVQFLANRGYAVLQMNYRGSDGYGRHFKEISYKQWGRDMQNDITDGVKWLVQQGIADPKRIGIYGGSYGGYATLAGVAFTPDLYAAAVDAFGVSNLFTFLKTIPPYWKLGQEQYRRRLGDPIADKEILERASPALHTDQIKTPLMVAQGSKDARVNKAESDQVVDSLRARGVPVEYLVYPNEGHGFSNQENKMDFYGKMEVFFEKHLSLGNSATQ